MKLENSVIIITGASSGIGESTALKLAKHGAKVVLTARREERLEKLKKKIEDKGGEALVVAGDVTKKDNFDAIVKKTLDTFKTVNVIVNNAGLMPLSYVEKFKTDEWNTMVDVNIKGVLNGVSAVLPTLIKNKGGHIINISSTAAYKYFPGGAVYCATKAAVKMFSEGLRQELTPKYGIRVTSIEPGAVSTELTETITDEDILEKFSDLKNMTTLESEDIAEAIIYALTQPDRVNINDVHVMPSEQQ
ncbi:SDR family oxidoreductase [Aquimarina sp. BL5]|uniref:SDR family oxidoreductase n=1 Tax=Aquimarina sp. BL5 TaxID=1714860 RepID=UPI000E505CDA|nr:SDR family oxidoreductase [Aquimarina sp. BL5]AXT49514.1 SDR family oxidoreductase [Aquimarina sp. BL5]RKM97806.1 SDR family NAD(P)-dependent oxidoreductase [Aquimarina sp. BL5]